MQTKTANQSPKNIAWKNLVGTSYHVTSDLKSVSGDKSGNSETSDDESGNADSESISDNPDSISDDSDSDSNFIPKYYFSKDKMPQDFWEALRLEVKWLLSQFLDEDKLNLNETFEQQSDHPVINHSTYHSPEISETDEENPSRKRKIVIRDFKWRSSTCHMFLRNYIDQKISEKSKVPKKRKYVYDNENFYDKEEEKPCNAPKWTCTKYKVDIIENSFEIVTVFVLLPIVIGISLIVLRVLINPATPLSAYTFFQFILRPKYLATFSEITEESDPILIMTYGTLQKYVKLRRSHDQAMANL
ncbi:hypothetical protein C1646_769412 [Rhizophagus diaphanus]|nr:hypothetical protein C1646_769412 [Rhizophagus diaphanus] [Rhizophagus sp. MUCL 43196]